jgi:hypothetical protein
MKTIKRLFRNAYPGEDIYSSATYIEGKWNYEKEYVTRTLDHQGFGKKAVVIGNGTSRSEFNLAEFQKSYVKTRIRTYGCNDLYQDYTPDFLVVTRPDTIKKVNQAGYCKDNVVYSGSDAILRYPGAFHLIPQDPSWNSGSIAAYLACFDGHPVVYLLGFDGNDAPDTNNNVYKRNEVQNDSFMSLTMTHVFKSYPLVDFVLVNSTGRGYMPAAWYGYTNLRRISFRDLVLECDL